MLTTVRTVMSPLMELYNELGMLAMEPNHAVTVAYTHTTKEEGEHTDLRTLSALRLRRVNGVPYVSAFCDKAQARQTFLLSRMEVICMYSSAGFAAIVGER